MKELSFSILIGIIAGIVDIIPMIIQKLDKRAIISAFLQYFFVSIVIINISLPNIIWWLKGGLVSFALSLPVLVILPGSERKAIPVIALMSIIIGTMVGVAEKFLLP